MLESRFRRVFAKFCRWPNLCHVWPTSDQHWPILATLADILAAFDQHVARLGRNWQTLAKTQPKSRAGLCGRILGPKSVPEAWRDEADLAIPLPGFRECRKSVSQNIDLNQKSKTGAVAIYRSGPSVDSFGANEARICSARRSVDSRGDRRTGR